MILYVIGPVTGMPDLNRAAFVAAREKLVAVGYQVRIPHDFIPADASHELAMRMSLRNILDNADGVAVLDGWLESDGARTEYACADACGVPILRVGGWAEFAELRRCMDVQGCEGGECSTYTDGRSGVLTREDFL